MEELKSCSQNQPDDLECFRESEDGAFLICTCCERFLFSPDLPDNLRKFCKGEIGKFKRPNSLNSQTNKDRRKRIKAHTSNSLHVWCSEKMKKVNEIQDEDISRNKKACDLILKNICFSIQSSGGAAEFLNLCNKDQFNFVHDFPT